MFKPQGADKNARLLAKPRDVLALVDVTIICHRLNMVVF